jgi:nitrate reductase molybdenum cofactor assembly chaperone
MSTNPFTTKLSALAGLLEYPGTGFGDRMSHGGPAAPRFAAGIASFTPDECEELYTSTFDVTPSCVLYVSIHLFGEENFKRGEFMAGLQARYQEAGFSATGELPDHLSVLLRFAAQAGNAERREIAEYCLLGPVAKMIAILNVANPYRALLEEVREALQGGYPGLQPALSPIEQMRRHGMACDTVNTTCGCGPAQIRDGPDDETAPVAAPSNTLISTT